MQIIEVHIRNYRSIAELSLTDLDNTVVFVGENDSGKSSALSAISTTLTGESWSGVRPKNKDTGEPIKCGPTSVRIVWDDGRSIEREYDGKKYQTRLYQGDNLIEQFNKLPESVERVQDFTGMKGVSVGKDTLWPQFERLDEPPFLITRTTPPALARRINAVIPGASIEAAQDSLRLLINRDNTKVKQANEALTDATYRLEILEEPFKIFETLVQDYEEVEEESRTVEDKIIRLQLLDADIDCVDKTLEDVYDTTAIIEGFISEYETLGTVKRKIELLQKYDNEIEDCATLLETFVSELEKVGDLSEIMDIGRRMESIIKQIEEIEGFQADMSSKSEELSIAKNELATTEKNLDKAMKAQKVCPTCKRPI